MKMKAMLNPATLEPRVVRWKNARQYYVRVGMLGEFTGNPGVYAAELWVGRKKDEMKHKAYSIRGLPPEDAKKIKHGEDLFERVYLILDQFGRPKGLQWRESTKLKKEGKNG